MNQAQLRDQIEHATPRERAQHKQWINWRLGSKLSKIMAQARHKLEAGLSETEIGTYLGKEHRCQQ